MSSSDIDKPRFVSASPLPSVPTVWPGRLMRFARTVVSVTFACFLIFFPTFFLARMKSMPPLWRLFTPLVFLPIAAAERRPGEDARARLRLADSEGRAEVRSLGTSGG